MRHKLLVCALLAAVALTARAVPLEPEWEHLGVTTCSWEGAKQFTTISESEKYQELWTRTLPGDTVPGVDADGAVIPDSVVVLPDTVQYRISTPLRVDFVFDAQQVGDTTFLAMHEPVRVNNADISDWWSWASSQTYYGNGNNWAHVLGFANHVDDYWDDNNQHHSGYYELTTEGEAYLAEHRSCIDADGNAKMFMHYPVGGDDWESPYHLPYSEDFLIAGVSAWVDLNVAVAVPGSLGQMLIEKCPNLNMVRNLTLTGKLDGDDMNVFARLFNLRSLDLSGAEFSTMSGCAGLPRLENVILPDRKLAIAQAAFQNCTSLVSVEMPKQMVEIGEYAFVNCRNLQAIDLSKSVLISGCSFQNCSSLKQWIYGRD